MQELMTDVKTVAEQLIANRCCVLHRLASFCQAVHMSQTLKNILAAAIVIAIIFVAWAIEALSDNRPGLWKRLAIWAAAVMLAAGALTVSLHFAHARDDGLYAASPHKEWFDSLRSGRGPCCSDADGSVVSDVDWQSAGGHYRVRLDGEWFDVPDEAVLTVPNLVGRTMVWPIRGYGGISIRCFIPGSMS